MAFGDKVGFAPTLDEALKQLFGGDSGAAAGDSDNNGQTPVDPAAPGTPAGADAKAELKAALDEANAAIREGQSALAAGDFAAYGEAQKKIAAALQKAVAAEAKIPVAAPEATPAPAATGAPEASPSPSATS